ncbi:hypothetical protein NQ314_017596 [Rhamnusium bicolor]|uniref:RNA-directed DNA polymerase n=1 Tax=Rhamnusium bicolor TaxID=1586634 RepID=A0AAV8WT00_9CUCU|nr:hypothetical protein NQ314_017596 [Rhamnusium bicolor]
MGSELDKLLEKLQRIEDSLSTYAIAKNLFHNYFETKRNNKIVKEINASDSDSSTEESSSEASITEIKNIKSVSKPWLVNIRILDRNVQFKVDSGADETIITTETYKKLKKSREVKLKSTKTRLVGPGNNSQEVGTINEVNEHLITKGEVKEKFPDLFKQLGQIKNFEYAIKLKDGTEPVAVQTTRSVALPLLEMDHNTRSLEKTCIKDIYAGHFGYVKCKARAKETIWWPSIKNYIEEKIKNCEKCLKNSKPMVEPMLSLETPFILWQTIGTDLTKLNGNIYLVIQDYYTRWPEIFELKNLKLKTEEVSPNKVKKKVTESKSKQQEKDKEGVVQKTGEEMVGRKQNRERKLPSYLKDYEINTWSSGPKFGPFNPETDDWTIYSEQLEQWFISTKIVEPTEKVANLLSVIGTQTYTLLRNLTFPELPASKSIAELLNLLSKQFCIPRNEWKEIRNFMEAAQEPQETVQDWSARVRKLAINCNFGTNLIYMLKVKFVTGMTKGKVFDRVIEEKQDEAMEKLTKLAVQKENWNERERAVNYVDNVDQHVDFVCENNDYYPNVKPIFNVEKRVFWVKIQMVNNINSLYKEEIEVLVAHRTVVREIQSSVKENSCQISSNSNVVEAASVAPSRIIAPEVTKPKRSRKPPTRLRDYIVEIES